LRLVDPRHLITGVVFMRSVPLLALALFLLSLEWITPAKAVDLPADHSIELRADLLSTPLASPLWSAKPALAAVSTPAVSDQLAEQSEPTRPAKSYGYADAHAAYQKCGKLCVLITTDNCPPCEEAKKWFGEVALSPQSGACIVLHEKQDAETLKEIQEDGEGYPQLVVYLSGQGTDVDAGELSRQVLVGFDKIAKRGKELAFGKSPAKLSVFSPVSHRVPSSCPSGGCQNCPADCAANGCLCGHTQAAQATGACGGGCGLVLGQPVRNLGRIAIGTARWFQEHQPARKAVRGVAAGTVKAVAGVVRGAARLLCSRCRRCR
jgi:hypothetical protein